MYNANKNSLEFILDVGSTYDELEEAQKIFHDAQNTLVELTSYLKDNENLSNIKYSEYKTLLDNIDFELDSSPDDNEIVIKSKTFELVLIARELDYIYFELLTLP